MLSHPRLQKLLQLWHEKRAERELPSRAQFDVLELGTWLGNLMIIEVRDGGTEFHYRLYGSNLAAAFGRDLTGLSTAALAESTRDTVSREYGDAVASRQPVFIERTIYAHHSYRPVVKLVLPLSTNGDVVDMLLVGAYPF